jgi:putative selenium metabolism hydrolase
MAAQACREIEKLNDRLKYDPFLGKGSVTVSEIVSESPSLCAVADFARIHLDRRLTRGETKMSAINEIEEIVSHMEANIRVLPYLETSYTGVKYGMDKYYPTWEITEDHEMVQLGKKVMMDLFNREPNVGKWTFSTNGVVINGVYGIPVIGFGPGDEVLAHAPNERVEIDQLTGAAAFYAGFVVGY